MASLSFLINLLAMHAFSRLNKCRNERFRMRGVPLGKRIFFFVHSFYLLFSFSNLDKCNSYSEDVCASLLLSY